MLRFAWRHRIGATWAALYVWIGSMMTVHSVPYDLLVAALCFGPAIILWRGAGDCVLDLADSWWGCQARFPWLYD